MSPAGGWTKASELQVSVRYHYTIGCATAQYVRCLRELRSSKLIIYTTLILIHFTLFQSDILFGGVALSNYNTTPRLFTSVLLWILEIMDNV